MKRVICDKYGGPEVLKFENVSIPAAKENEVLIKIQHCSVSQADIKVRSFNIPLAFWLPAKFILGLRRPKNNILGAEISGVVTSIGESVTKFKKGDQVMANLLPSFGGYSEYICLKEKGNICIAPSNLALDEVATLPIGASTAIHYLEKATPTPSAKILIYGSSGSVGTYAVQMAKHMHLEVTTVCSSRNFNIMQTLGVDFMLDYNHPDFYKQLKLYDIIFVAIDRFPFSIARKHINKKGTYINIVKITKSFNMLRVQKQLGISVFLSQDTKDEKQLLNKVKELVELGVIKPVMDKVFPINEIKAAHEYVDNGHKVGNVCLKVSS